MMLSLVKKLAPCAAAVFIFTAAADAAHAKPRKAKAAEPATVETVGDNDPFEPFNRVMFGFNRGVDRFLLRPVAQGYRYITPRVVRTHIGHFTDNIYEPVNTVNALLQGDIQQGMVSFWRFVLNTTVGIVGINDVATEAGLPYRTEDFGQTLAVWGVGSGPYIVLPLIGPSSARDTVGTITDFYTNPIFYAIDDTEDALAISAGRAVVQRERYMEVIDDVYASSIDPYVTFRSIYEQRRKAQIANRHRDNNPVAN